MCSITDNVILALRNRQLVQHLGNCGQPNLLNKSRLNSLPVQDQVKFLRQLQLGEVQSGERTMHRTSNFEQPGHFQDSPGTSNQEQEQHKKKKTKKKKTKSMELEFEVMPRVLEADLEDKDSGFHKKAKRKKKAKKDEDEGDLDQRLEEESVCKTKNKKKKKKKRDKQGTEGMFDEVFIKEEPDTKIKKKKKEKITNTIEQQDKVQLGQVENHDKKKKKKVKTEVDLDEQVEETPKVKKRKREKSHGDETIEGQPKKKKRMKKDGEEPQIFPNQEKSKEKQTKNKLDEGHTKRKGKKKTKTAIENASESDKTGKESKTPNDRIKSFADIVRDRLQQRQEQLELEEREKQKQEEEKRRREAEQGQVSEEHRQQCESVLSSMTRNARSEINKMLTKNDIFEVASTICESAPPRLEDESDSESDSGQKEEEADETKSLMSYVWPKIRLSPATEPLCHKVISWILTNDFPLPKLNHMVYKRLDFLLEKDALKVRDKFPKYKSGRFSLAEDSVVLRNYKAMVDALKLTEKDREAMADEFKTIRKSENCPLAKLVLGAYLGRPLLKQRRCYEVYRRFYDMSTRSKTAKILRNEPQAISKMLEKFKQEAGSPSVMFGQHFRAASKAAIEARKSVGLSSRVFEAERVVTMTRNLEGKGKKGQLDLEEVEEIIRQMMRIAKRRKCKITELAREDEGKGKEVDWLKLVSHLPGRCVRSIRMSWKGRIAPAIATHLSGQDPGDRSWEKSFIQAILDDETITERRLISYPKLARQIPNQTCESLRRVLDSYMQMYKDHCDTFRDTLEMILHYLHNIKKPYSVVSKKAAMPIIAIYEKLAEQEERRKEDSDDDEDDD